MTRCGARSLHAGPPGLEDALQRISTALIRAPHHRLAAAIDTALDTVGVSLAADEVLVFIRKAGRIARRAHSWQRRRNGVSSSSPGKTACRILDAMAIGHPIACTSRKQLAASAARLFPGHVESALFVPIRVESRTTGVLAVLGYEPRCWPDEAIEACVRAADLLAAGFERMATLSTLSREQDARLHAEAETRRLRDQLAHTGRVSMLGELAASLAHEVNQPLTAIYSNAQAAQRFLDRKRPALGEARDALHDLGQDCRRASDVLGRLRQMFRRQETERASLEVGAIVEHVMRLLHEDAVSRGVNITVDVAPHLPPVNGDRVQLEQVVMNLLVNAFDAVSDVAGAREVKVRAAARDGVVNLRVHDSGCGIARGDLERIFDPFFTRKPNGMGIGLAICRTIVEAHGGRISAQNRAQRGSIFEVTLPAIAATA